MPTPPKGTKRYKEWRRRYEPEVAKLIIVAESPPISGLYLYNPDGSVSEPLFAALMKALGLSPTTKASGLRALQQRGWVLVDSTYEPVNELSGTARNAVIRRDYPLLRDDLAGLTQGRAVPLVLIKANVCRLLESSLVADGFHVLNGGRKIYFPANGWQGDFQRQFADVLRSAETE
ncbi:hypothetical protein [Methyloceanibacter sp. wino2]|uniref:hypothetical protein n=1 Tax=Methyloceanibacter sp. wino2 TaxID=2170729 RepID=UPI000D3E4504|nr:hypothetical protein [Methyloceanibacter sp. wino2]